MSEPTPEPTSAPSHMTLLHKALPAVMAATIVGGVGFILNTKDELAKTQAEIAAMSKQVNEIFLEINRLHPRQ